MDIPTSTAYLAEIAPTRHRGKVLDALTQITWILGTLTSTLVAIPLQWMFGDVTWRWMFGLAALPAALVLLGRRGLPESPRWVIRRPISRATASPVSRPISASTSPPSPACSATRRTASPEVHAFRRCRVAGSGRCRGEYHHEVGGVGSGATPVAGSATRWISRVGRIHLFIGAFVPRGEWRASACWRQAISAETRPHCRSERGIAPSGATMPTGVLRCFARWLSRRSASLSPILGSLAKPLCQPRMLRRWNRRHAPHLGHLGGGHLQQLCRLSDTLCAHPISVR